MTSDSPRPRATVREVPRGEVPPPPTPAPPRGRGAGGEGADNDGADNKGAPSRTSTTSSVRYRGAPSGAAQALRVMWGADLTLRINAAIALVVAGTGLVFGLSSADYAVLVIAATVVVVTTLVRGALAAGAENDGPSSRAFGLAAQYASGAVVIAMVGATVVTVIVFGARLVGALR